MSKRNPSTCCTLLFSTEVTTSFGEQVVVVGDIVELGEWNPPSGLKLTTSSDVYPLWHSSRPVYVEPRTHVQYQFAVLDSRGTVLRWLSQKCVDVIPEDPGTYNLGSEKETDSLGSPRDAASHPLELLFQRTNANTLQALDSATPSIDTIALDDEDDMQGNYIWVVSFELPLDIQRDPSAPEGFTVELKKSLVLPSLYDVRTKLDPLNRKQVKFVGCPCLPDLTEDERTTLSAILDDYDCLPVYLDNDLLGGFNAFTNEVLWPFFHQSLPMDSLFYSNHAALWRAYQRVNTLFANSLIYEIDPYDLVWVHDYHLMLVAQNVVRRVPQSNIGLFFHVPFPSSENFRCFPYREELLRGILCSDMVGFHMFEYARHFLVSCKRLLGLDHSFRLGGHLCVETHGRDLSVRMGHACLDFTKLQKEVVSNPRHHQMVEEFSERFAGKFVFGSVDRLTRMSGLHTKLSAFEELCLANGSREVVLVQYAYPVK
ncbi:MAG: hypothetical protein KVP17_004813 [Porospora cf. gigantea B]|nr:MAG: hypothetical protein KVP17_004813 [Porospora cf. gigantea B]